MASHLSILLGPHKSWMGQWDNVIFVVWLVIITAWGILSDIFREEIRAKFGLKVTSSEELSTRRRKRFIANVTAIVASVLFFLIWRLWIART
jgi:hypothetical protein